MFIVFGKKAFYAIFALLLVLTAATVSLLLPPEAVETSVSAPTGKTVWVIDAGHGGEDGGAVAADGSKESDMNLAIARRLDALLIFLGEETRMTRAEDISIHDASASTLREKKRSDLENRVGLVNSTQGAILVSIHQNSLPSSKQTHGAQVFYGKKEGSDEVANAVQLALNQTVNAGNEKTEKAIDASIFLMKNVTAPAILIECGFLSNENETALLKSGEYQQRLAVVIASGLFTAAVKQKRFTIWQRQKAFFSARSAATKRPNGRPLPELRRMEHTRRAGRRRRCKGKNRRPQPRAARQGAPDRRARHGAGDPFSHRHGRA